MFPHGSFSGSWMSIVLLADHGRDMTSSPLLLVRPGHPFPDGVAGAEVLSAMSFALLTTALATVGYHLAFADTASVNACLVAVIGLFAGRLLCARRPRSLIFDTCAMALAQVSMCYWFASYSPDFGLASPTFHGALATAVHLTTTLIAVFALRAAEIPRFVLSGVVQEGLSAVAQFLRVLIIVQAPENPAPYASRCTGARRGGDEEAVSEALLAHAVGRRGPP